jgi:OPA family glycerol-3-phosphate transporter-like MFS transporter
MSREGAQTMTRWRTIVALGAGYVGIYLCRKNLAVAIPLLQAEGVSHAALGRVASVGTITYAAGKLLLGPMADRVGGRRAFLFALAAVAVLGALGGIVPGLWLLTVVYALNRFFGAGGWPAMMKLVPTWFPKERTAGVVAALSLSYVLGGIAATLFAREVVTLGGGWRAVMSAPSLALGVIALACVWLVRTGPLEAQSQTSGTKERVQNAVASLLRRPQFIVVCVLSFALTMLRETFNVWSVDFLMSMQGKKSVAAAALQSTTFDLAGAASIVIMGVVYDRVPRPLRRWMIAAILAALSALLFVLPGITQKSPQLGAWTIGAVGLLVYGPYSLLAGVLAVESGGAELAASASGIIDAVGYAAGVLSGEVLGRIIDAGGYRLGFTCLAVLAALSAVCASRLAKD